MSIPSEHRLRKHAEFEVVYRCGQRHFSQALTAFYLLRTEPETVQPKTSGEAERNPRSSRVGITVGRVMGKAVVRNRIKRRVRAAVTQNLARLARPVDVVINPKKAALEMEFTQLSAEVARAFDVVEQKATVGSNKIDRALHRSTKSDRLAARKS